MKPYYSDDWVTLYHGDAVNVLYALAAEETPPVIQAVLTDPPYASGARQEAAKPSSGAMLRGARWNSKPIENDQMTTAGFVWLMRAVAFAVRPMLADGGNFLSFIDWRQWPNLVGAIESTNMRVNGMVVWDKMSMGLGNGFRAQHELILHASMGVCDPDNRSTGNVLKVPPDPIEAAYYEGVPDAKYNAWLGTVVDCPRDNNELHPSPKPVPLMVKLMRVVSAPGDVVLDCFAGAGATGVAAKSERRKCILIEGIERHCETAAVRLSQEVMHLEMPEAPEVDEVGQEALALD